METFQLKIIKRIQRDERERETGRKTCNIFSLAFPSSRSLISFFDFSHLIPVLSFSLFDLFHAILSDLFNNIFFFWMVVVVVGFFVIFNIIFFVICLIIFSTLK